MPIDYEKVVKESFENVGPKNPLKRLSDSDKRLLLAFLDVYVKAPDLAPAYLLWEKAAGIASEANSLGRSIRSVVFEGHLAEALAPFVEGFQDLPARLLSFSLHLGDASRQCCWKAGTQRKGTEEYIPDHGFRACSAQNWKSL
jgi:hypothetical protein